MALIDKLNAIGEAIRGKTGKTEKLTLAQMPDEITAIQCGGGGSSEKEQAYLDYITTLLNRNTTSYIELTIPDEITNLGIGALYGWSYGTGGLYKLDLNKVTSIGPNALYECTRLSELTADNLVTTNSDSFRNCTRLVSLSFPMLEKADNNAFRGCSGLEVIDFGKLKSMMGTSYNACSKLKTLIIRTNSVCSLGNKFPSGATFMYGGTASIYVPDELVESYKSATNWVDYADMIKPLSEYTE